MIGDILFYGVPALLGAVAISTVAAICFRIVVPTNAVHIVQSGRRTISFGKDQAKNVYYRWPAWVPHFGVRTTVLPVSVFSLTLNDYAAYDKGRVPFVLDIIAFFRVADSNVAAQRVEGMKELEEQLEFILKGAIRTLLASSEIEEILEGRSKFGEMFTKEVDEQLKQWGVQTVKCIELMDIRDANGSAVIANIMAKKKSLIEMQSRTEVANNIQKAQTAEIEAAQTVQVRKQEMEQAVGERSAAKDQAIGIAAQKAAQAVKEQEAETARKQMAVQEVNAIRQAEITRSAQLVAADQARQITVVNADANKQQAVLVADGQLEAAKRGAEAIKVQGEAKGAAEQAVLMAPVNAQISLAKEIGANEKYQQYLVTVRQIEANQAVGIEQAHALQKADVKVIANTGAATDGVKSVMDLFTSKGGTQIGAALEALKQTPAGAALLGAVQSTMHRNGAGE